MDELDYALSVTANLLGINLSSAINQMSTGKSLNYMICTFAATAIILGGCVGPIRGTATSKSAGHANGIGGRSNSITVVVAFAAIDVAVRQRQF